MNPEDKDTVEKIDGLIERLEFMQKFNQHCIDSGNFDFF